MARRAMTHCSVCGRRLRFKPAAFGAGTAPADWLNHRRDCPRYGQSPDSNHPKGHTMQTTTNLTARQMRRLGYTWNGYAWVLRTWA